MKDTMLLTELSAIKAYSDPYKIKILQTYYKLNQPATVKQIADYMGEVPAKVHYHVKKLEAVGILKLMHTREINGITAKYYQPMAKHFDISQDVILPPTLMQLGSTIHEESLAAVFDDHKGFCIQASRIPTAVDPFILSAELYLNHKEYQELIAYVQALQIKCQRKSGKKKTYKLLASLSQTNSTESV